MKVNTGHLPSFIFTITMLLIVVSACNTNKSAVDPVAALYSYTQVLSNIKYTRSDTSLLLDIYVPYIQLGQPPWVEYSAERKPTLIYFHGGGFVSGDKISRSLFLMPYVSKGWAVVTVNYRLIDKTTLGGTITDCKAAINWVYEHAAKYKFDTTHIILSGESAGGYEALMSGLTENGTAFPDTSVNPKHQIHVAGIVNWFGPTDMKLMSPREDAYYKTMFGSTAGLDSLLRVYSPVGYVGASSPPVITIQGEVDPLVPVAQAVALKTQLDKFAVKNDLFIVKGRKHGDFDGMDMTESFNHIWKFMDELGIRSPTPVPK